MQQARAREISQTSESVQSELWLHRNTIHKIKRVDCLLTHWRTKHAQDDCAGKARLGWSLGV